MNRLGRGAATLTAAIAAVFVVLTCTNDSRVTRNSDAGPAMSVQRESPTLTGRAAEAMARTKWVGNVHDEAVRDFVGNSAYFMRRDDPRRLRRCLGLERVLRKYGPRIDSIAGVVRTVAGREAMIRAVLNRSEVCTNSSMSLFALPAFTLPTAAALFEDTVTGAYASYAQEVHDGVSGTSAVPPEVTSVAQGVVTSASWIPSPDLEVVAAVANLAISSSGTWYEVGLGGGLDSIPNQMSMFRRGWLARLKGIVMADIAGCVYGVSYMVSLGLVVPGVLLAACEYFGTGASIGAAQQ